MSVKFEKNGIVGTSGLSDNPNLLINSDFHSLYNQTSGWDTTKNGTLLASSWGGYNSGVTNPSTVYHAHITNFDGQIVYDYTRTSNETWLGISQGGLQSKVAANTTYTWSLEQYRTGNNYCTAGLYFFKTGATSANFHSGCPGYATALNQWVRCVYTFTLPSDIDLSKNVSMYIYGHANGNGTVYMRHPKLEVGSVATPWCLAQSEGYGLNNHGFIESGSRMQTYKDYIQANEFIEW